MIAYAPSSVLVRPGPAARGDHRRRPGPRHGRRPGETTTGWPSAGCASTPARTWTAPGAGSSGCRSTAPTRPRGRSRSTSSGTRPNRRRWARSWPWRAAPATRAPAAATTTSSCSAACSAPATCCWSTTAAPAPPALINCRPLQRWHLALGDEEYDRRLAACGDQLNTARPLPGGGSCTAATCTAPPTPPVTWPTCSPPSRPGRSTCTATPTAATSARPSPPATRGCCGR